MTAIKLAGFANCVSDADKRKLYDALIAFRVAGVQVQPNSIVGNSGVIEMIRTVAWCNERFTYYLWYFHDALYGKPWEEQVKIIAAEVGPTPEFHPLITWAWLTYDGWVKYVQVHKSAPIDVEAYINAHLTATNLTEVHLKEF